MQKAGIQASLKPQAPTWAVAGMILLAAALRIIPHLPNFSPITAMALFGGAYFSRKSFAVLVPLAAMLLSDWVIGFHAQMPVVYVSFVLVSILGMSLHEQRRPANIAAASMIGSLLFFIITNFGVWMEGAIYSKTLTGLVECYVAALPFFRNSIIGDLFYTAVLFGAWASMTRMVPRLRGA